ncbi:MAG: hypothetical protein VW268_10640 [Rhodospirillaceae bacterium]
MTALIVRLLMEGTDMGDHGNAKPFDGCHAPDFTVSYLLMKAHHADQPTRDIYEDIREVLGLPLINTDYRALARWPTYWEAAWSGLRKAVRTSDYEDLCQELHGRILDQVRNGLPNPGGLSAEWLHAAAMDAPAHEVIQVCRLFQWLLPWLSVNVAYLRAQLLDR